MVPPGSHLQRVDDGVDDLDRDALLRLDRRGAQVRRADDVGAVDQGVGCTRDTQGAAHECTTCY